MCLTHKRSYRVLLTVFACYSGRLCRHVVDMVLVLVRSRLLVLVKVQSQVLGLVRRRSLLLCRVPSALGAAVRVSAVHAGTHAAAQLQPPHVSHHRRRVEGLLLHTQTQQDGVDEPLHFNLQCISMSAPRPPRGLHLPSTCSWQSFYEFDG